MPRVDVPPRPRASNPDGQVTATPWDFFNILNAEFNFAVDLAASEHNAKCERYLTRYDNAFTVDWSLLAPGRWLWLNPPFADLTPWAERCAFEKARGAKIALLTQASVDTFWYRDHVEGVAEVRFLNPRIKFIGHKHTFPKPLMLSLFDGNRPTCAWQWRWK